MIAVPALKKGGLEQKKAHATSIAVTSALSLVSAVIYWYKGALEPKTAVKFMPLGLAGAALGALLLKRIPNKGLKSFFNLVMIIAGIRILLR